MQFKKCSALYLCVAVFSVAATGQVTGSGTTNKVPKFTSSTMVGDSAITESNGNVGIGTTTPGNPLSVVGYSGGSQSNVATFANGTNDAYTSLSSAGTASSVGTWNNGSQILEFVPYSSGNGIVSSYTGALLFQTFYRTVQMAILPSGNVGIGTTAPSAKLEISSGISGQTAPMTALQIDGPNSPTNSNSAQDLSWSFVSAGSAKLRAYRGGSWDTYLQFLTNSAAQGSDSPQVRMTIDQLGNVGIGANSPTAKLEVNGNLKLSAGSGGSITFPDGTTQSTAWTGTLCGGDYAESVDVSGDRGHYEPGDVLRIDDDNPSHFLKVEEAYSTAIAGVYSTRPGALGRRQATPKSSDEVPLAMIGIVPVKVSAENGRIRPHDLLVSSSKSGYAMKGTDKGRMLGAVIGKSMGSLDSGTGVIEVLVTLQ
jgi:hypothetical protein